MRYQHLGPRYHIYVPNCSRMLGLGVGKFEFPWIPSVSSEAGEYNALRGVNEDWYHAHIEYDFSTYLNQLVSVGRVELVEQAADADFCVESCSESCPAFDEEQVFLRLEVIAFPRCSADESKCCRVQIWDEKPGRLGECTMVAPYFHGVHAGTWPPPWEALASSARPVLLTFVGSSYRGFRAGYLHELAAAAGASSHPRAFEVHLVHAYRTPVLSESEPQDGENSHWGSQQFYLQIWEAYAQASFCLQPPGDTLTRRGFYDAWLHGCIPVISRASASQYAKLFNGMLFRDVDELSRTAVVIEDKDMHMDMKHGDGGAWRLLDFLLQKSKAEISERQRRLRRSAYALQWSLQDSVPLMAVDALELTLLAARSLSRHVSNSSSSS